MAADARTAPASCTPGTACSTSARRRGASTTVSTLVHFADVTDEEIDAYCATGEPTQVAGAFTIDGLGGWFVDAVEGDHHNVVGLSLPVLRQMLARPRLPASPTSATRRAQAVPGRAELARRRARAA